MKNLIIIGASGFGREVAWLVERINAQNPSWNLLGFADDSERLIGKIINGYPVLGNIASLEKYQNCYFVCAIGSSKIRKDVIGKITNYKFATLVDPTVQKSNLISIGEGSIICSNTIITVNVNIGKHVIINLGCTIGHDAVINDFVTLYPSVNVSGMTEIGIVTEIGTGTQIIQGKKIGDHTIIGAGAVVVKDVPSKCTAVGIPAKPIKFYEE